MILRARLYAREIVFLANATHVWTVMYGVIGIPILLQQ